MRTHTVRILPRVLVVLTAAAMLLLSLASPAAAQAPTAPEITATAATVTCDGPSYVISIDLAMSDADGLGDVIAIVVFAGEVDPFVSPALPLEGATEFAATFGSPFDAPPIGVLFSVVDVLGAESVLPVPLSSPVCPEPAPVSYPPVVTPPVDVPTGIGTFSPADVFEMITPDRYSNKGNAGAVFGGATVQSGPASVVAAAAGGAAPAVTAPTVISSSGTSHSLAVTGSTSNVPLAGGVVLVAVGLIVMGLSVRSRTE